MDEQNWVGPLRRLFGGGRRERTRGTWHLVSSLGLVLLLVSVVLGACAQDARAAAQREKSRLDREMQAARAHLNVPDGLLQPIVAQEQGLAAGAAGGSDASYGAATNGYRRLYDQVVAIEHMTPAQVRAQVQGDLQRLTAALQHAQSQGFEEAAHYQPGVQQAQQQLDAATASRDYFTVDGFVQTQTATVQRIEPVYQQLQALNALVDAQNSTFGLVSPAPQPLQCARGANEAYFWPNPNLSVTPPQAQGAPRYEYQQWPEQDLTEFRAASSIKQYDALAALMTAQAQQLTADATLATAPAAQRVLQAFQADVQAYQQAGGKDGSYQQQVAQVLQAYNVAKTAADYRTLAQTAQQQRQALALPLAKAETERDLQTLQQLVNKAQAIKTIDPANGLPYADGYEYASAATGIGDARDRLANAQTVGDFQTIDDEIKMFTTNLQAMLQNLGDKTASDRPHQTDLSLLQHYNIADTRVIVISLREQMARMYDSGKLVKTAKVTTGNPDLPSPPGVHCVLAKMQNYDDISPFPKGSPWYYNPTHINFGMVYSDYGYIVHDAWWRSWFGKYSNLPHFDPISFNNGSHGCINFSLADMPWVYKWSQIGTPVLVY